ncbi:MAG: ribosome maturation factor RimP [Desulfobacterales bacterium]|nr:ribosome maturation factor RimP [Desulfobacterales bacterium]
MNSVDIGTLTRLIMPVLDEIGFELVDIEYLSGRGRWILRIYVDKTGGITLDDCARVSREIGDLIDIKDIINHKYVLEVSSPGLDRPLRKEADFFKAIGKKVKVKMLMPIKGRRNFTGYLKDFQQKTLYLEVENKIVELPHRDVKKAKILYEFK